MAIQVSPSNDGLSSSVGFFLNPAFHPGSGEYCINRLKVHSLHDPNAVQTATVVIASNFDIQGSSTSTTIVLSLFLSCHSEDAVYEPHPNAPSLRLFTDLLCPIRNRSTHTCTNMYTDCMRPIPSPPLRYPSRDLYNTQTHLLHSNHHPSTQHQHSTKNI